MPKNQHNNHDENEIAEFKKLINGSLNKIQSMQEELSDLEKELSNFFNHYYGSKQDSLENETLNAALANLEHLKNDIFNKIAKLCSKESISNHTSPENLLKVEGYLNEGSEQNQAPNEQLSDLMIEYYNLIKKVSEEKLKEPAHEVKQAIMWINVKASETIAKIKEEINNRMNRPH